MNILPVVSFGFVAMAALTVSFTSSKTSARNCLSNNLPGNQNLCLRSMSNASPINCGTGHGGNHLGGPYSIIHVSLTCNDSRRWNLTCRSGGTECNISDQEFCVGLSQWNVGQHCTLPANPNG